MNIIYNLIEKELANSKSVNVIISGMTCSGKSTLATNIAKHFENKYNSSIICQDDYFKDLKDIPRSAKGYQLDSIHAFCEEEFKEDMSCLIENKSTIIPKYDIKTNSRISKNTTVNLADINIFEGLHTISLLSNLKNSIKIYLDIDLYICIQRRIARDTAKYNIPEYVIREYFMYVMMPMYEKYILPQKEFSNIVIKKESGELYEC